jgi:hypothetical protein
VNELSTDPERVGCRLSILIEGVVNMATHRSHRKSIVVVTNVLAECVILLSSQEVQQLRRWLVNRRKGDLPTEATHAKLRTAMG